MISIIAAEAKNKVIGKGGEIPWKLSDDLKHFAKITKGHTVIMGRKTYESIAKRLGHALPDRKNVVITSNRDYVAPDSTVVHSVEEALNMFSSDKEEIFVIGGSEIYKQFLPAAQKMYITEVSLTCDGDAYFPPYSNEDWDLVSTEVHKKDERNSCDFTFLEFIRK